MASLGPTMTLDTLVEVLLISIGTISGGHIFYQLLCFRVDWVLSAVQESLALRPCAVLAACPSQSATSSS